MIVIGGCMKKVQFRNKQMKVSWYIFNLKDYELWNNI